MKILSLACTACSTGYESGTGIIECPRCGSTDHVDVRDTRIAISLRATTGDRT